MALDHAEVMRAAEQVWVPAALQGTRTTVLSRLIPALTARRYFRLDADDDIGYSPSIVLSSHTFKPFTRILTQGSHEVVFKPAGDFVLSCVARVSSTAGGEDPPVDFIELRIAHEHGVRIPLNHAVGGIFLPVGSEIAIPGRGTAEPDPNRARAQVLISGFGT
ncbi:MAG: hypothetical protein HY791_22385 [Deltaproteobacteria bacterium]|nr:hypothetical protein [Deltaproteobacteria bacterium]